MLQKPKCPVIALEEHYWDEELATHARAVQRNPGITERLFDIGELRVEHLGDVLGHVDAGAAPFAAGKILLEIRQLSRQCRDAQCLAAADPVEGGFVGRLRLYRPDEGDGQQRGGASNRTAAPSGGHGLVSPSAHPMMAP